MTGRLGQTTVVAPVEHRFDVYIRASPETVWTTIIDPSLTPHFFMGLSVASSWHVGSPVRQIRADGQVWNEGVVEEIDPPRRLVTSFRLLTSQTSRDPPSRVTWSIESAGEATHLMLIHQFGKLTPTYEVVRDGWAMVLSALKTWLETGQILRLPSPPEFENR